MNSKEVLEREIAELEAQIRIRRSALHALQSGQSKEGDPKLRFYDWRPLDAVLLLIDENGGQIERTRAEDLLLEGGLATGKKRGRHNIRISFDTNLAIGNLIEKDGILSRPN